MEAGISVILGSVIPEMAARAERIAGRRFWRNVLKGERMIRHLVRFCWICCLALPATAQAISVQAEDWPETSGASATCF